ncbi:MAG: hypothetical protein ACYCZB_11815 [Acidiphilium sp.]
MEELLAIIGAGAGVMALICVFQMWFGRPSLTIEYHHSHYEEENHKILAVLRNKTVSYKILKLLGVTRTKGVIRGNYKIKTPDCKILASGAQWFRRNYGQPEIVLHLEEQEWGTLTCVHKLHHNKYACASEEEYLESIRLVNGEYIYWLELTVSGGLKSLIFEKQFRIEENSLYWIGK